MLRTAIAVEYQETRKVGIFRRASRDGSGRSVLLYARNVVGRSERGRHFGIPNGSVARLVTA